MMNLYIYNAYIILFSSWKTTVFAYDNLVLFYNIHNNNPCSLYSNNLKLRSLRVEWVTQKYMKYVNINKTYTPIASKLLPTMTFWVAVMVEMNLSGTPASTPPGRWLPSAPLPHPLGPCSDAFVPVALSVHANDKML